MRPRVLAMAPHPRERFLVCKQRGEARQVRAGLTLQPRRAFS